LSTHRGRDEGDDAVAIGELSDQTLIDLVNAGGNAEARGFDALYQRHKLWVFNLALRFTRDHDLASDVTQEVFMYFLRKFPGFTLSAKLTTFFYPAVKNLSLTAKTKTRRYAGNDEALKAERGDVGQDRAVQESQSRTELSAVMSALPDAQREVVLMRFVDDFSLAEIGDALGIPTGTVKSRLHNAIRQLREDERLKKYFNL